MDSIPDVRGRDQSALIERRLKQHFPDTSLRLAKIADRKKPTPEKRGLRLSALPQHGALSPWLSALSRQHSLLRGIYSVTQLNTAILEILELPRQPCLLFIRDGATLHQHFIDGPDTQLSRHLPWTEHEPEEVQREAEKLQQFLINQHQIRRDEKPPVYAIGLPKETMAAPSPGIHMLTPALPLAELYLKAFKNLRPKISFAPPELRQAARLAKLRLVATLVTATFSLCAISFAASQQFETARLQQQSIVLQAEADNLATMPIPDMATDLPLPVDQLRLLTRRHESLISAQRDPQADFIWLSRTLDQHPVIEIDRLEWWNNDGKERLRIEGHLNNSEPNEQIPRLNGFIASLNVDRSRLIRSNFSDSSPQGIVKGSSEQPFKAPTRPVFVLETGEKP